MKERLMFEEYENLAEGVVVKNRQGMLWIPGYRVDGEGHLERIPRHTEIVESLSKGVTATEKIPAVTVGVDLGKGKDTTVKTIVNKR